LEVVDKILKYLKTDLVGQSISKKSLENVINKSLKEVIEGVLIEPFDLIEKIKTTNKCDFDLAIAEPDLNEKFSSDCQNFRS